jgi:F420H(2)-dependent quinone reductase
MSLSGQVLKIHGKLYERTDGRIGHRTIGVPSLLLRSTGRKSGAIRTNAIVYARDGGDYLLVASNGGADRPPGWLHNVRAKPEVEIQVGRQRQAGLARVIDSADPSYERLWKLVNDNNKHRFEAYQKLTSRPIQIVAVTPAG